MTKCNETYHHLVDVCLRLWSLRPTHAYTLVSVSESNWSVWARGGCVLQCVCVCVSVDVMFW